MSRSVANGVRDFARALGEGTGRSQDEVLVLSVAAASVVVTVAAWRGVAWVVGTVTDVALRPAPLDAATRSSIKAHPKVRTAQG
jgi:hypothetical protein